MWRNLIFAIDRMAAAHLLDIPRTLLYDLGYYHAFVAMRDSQSMVGRRLARG